MSETPTEPEYYNVEYSGSADGDARDLVSIGDSIEQLQPDLARRMAESNLLQGRQEVIDLEADVIASKAAPYQLREAKDRLEQLEAEARKWQPPSE